MRNSNYSAILIPPFCKWGNPPQSPLFVRLRKYFRRNSQGVVTIDAKVKGQCLTCKGDELPCQKLIFKPSLFFTGH